MRFAHGGERRDENEAGANVDQVGILPKRFENTPTVADKAEAGADQIQAETKEASA